VTDTQTDTQTPHDGIGRAYASHRAAKTDSFISSKNSQDAAAESLILLVCIAGCMPLIVAMFYSNMFLLVIDLSVAVDRNRLFPSFRRKLIAEDQGSIFVVGSWY